MAWNKSSENGEAVSRPLQKRKGFRFPVRGAIAGAIVVVGAGIAAWWLWPDSKPQLSTSTSTSTSLIREAKPQRNVVPRPQTDVKPAKKPTDGATLLSARTNANGVIYEEYRLADGKTMTKRRNPPPVFSNLCEKVIAMVVTSSAGGRVPPLPPMSDDAINKAFAESLLSPIRVSETDSEKVAALKLAVKGIKAEISALLKEGDERSVAQMLRDHVEDTNRSAEMRANAIKEVMAVRKKEGDEFADAYLQKVNEHLRSYGVRPIGESSDPGPGGENKERKKK